MLPVFIAFHPLWRVQRFHQLPPWRPPRGKWMVSLVNSHTNATSKRWHLWEIDLRFVLISTPGWRVLARGQSILVVRFSLYDESTWKAGAEGTDIQHGCAQPKYSPT